MSKKGFTDDTLPDLTNWERAEISSWKLSITWSDGKVEGLASGLPEYLEEELFIYFRELEDLREEHDLEMREEEYNFETDEWKETK
jgi:hypothetical protein